MWGTRSRSSTCSPKAKVPPAGGMGHVQGRDRRNRPGHRDRRALGKPLIKVCKMRSEDIKGRQGICNHANLLTGKLFCTDCGAAYYRRESKDKQGNKNSKWVCSNKIKNGADACASFPIYEEELKPLLFEVFRKQKPLQTP